MTKNYTEMYSKDKNYQELIGKYFNGVDTIQSGVKLQTINAKTAQEMGTKLYSDLQNGLHEFNVAKRQELHETAERIAAELAPKFDYESVDAKNRATRLKLKSKLELEDMVNAAGSDLMELHLLRLELKDRGLDNLDERVSQHIMRNRLESGHLEHDDYKAIAENLATLNTMGSNGLIVLGEYKYIANLPSEFDEKINAELKAANERGFDPSTSHTLIEEVRSNRDALAAIQ